MAFLLNKYVAIFAAILLVAVTVGTDTALAVQNCYGFGASTRFETTTSVARRFQTFIAPNTAISSLSLNVYNSDVSATSLWFFSIVNVNAGKPDGALVAGSQVTFPIVNSPFSAGVGVNEAFDCGNIVDGYSPPVAPNQTIVFPTPITLTPGVEYAFSVYEAGTGVKGRIGYITGFPSAVPGKGWGCILSCTIFTENTFGGMNYDYVYSFEDATIGATTNDGKIDGQIQGLRNYLQLDGSEGGLMFGLGVMGIVFAIGLLSKVPFIIVAVLNLLLVGIFSRAQIMPPWVILAVVAIAGIAVLFRLIGGNGGRSNEV